MDLKGKRALITGSAHRVGRGIALALAREGVDIILHYGRAAGEAMAAKAEIESLGVRVLPYQADLADPEAIAGMFAAVETAFGGLDILVNSAASFEKMLFALISAADWDRSMVINLRAPFLTTQAAAPLMRKNPRSRGETALIVNISDLSGVYPWRGYIQHGVSKAGLIHLTKITARELAPEIRVNAIVPGPILPPPGMSAGDPKWAAMVEATPLKRDGSPDLIGQTVIFFAQNDFITGDILHLDGGESLLGSGIH